MMRRFIKPGWNSTVMCPFCGKVINGRGYPLRSHYESHFDDAVSKGFAKESEKPESGRGSTHRYHSKLEELKKKGWTHE